MTARYSEHLDTIVAVATNLAMTRHKARTPSKLAGKLALDDAEVLHVLETFKGLFRKSKNKKNKTGEHYYTLHVRYALRRPDDDDEGARAPLETAQLALVLDLVANRAQQEQESERHLRGLTTTMVSALIAASAALLAAVLAFVAATK